MKWSVAGLSILVSMMAMAESPAPEKGSADPLKDGLVAYWTFDGKSTETAEDMVGENDLMLIGAGRVAGIRGGGLFFDGSVTYAKRNHDQLVGPLPAMEGHPLPSFSLAAWVRLSPADHRHPIVTKEGNLKRGFMLTIERNGQLAAHLFNAQADRKVTIESTGKVPRARWCHLAMTFLTPEDGPGQVRLYIDGKLDGRSEHVPLPLATNSQPLEVGRVAWSSAYVRHMFGRIDELRIYDRALSEEEVAALAAQTE